MELKEITCVVDFELSEESFNKEAGRTVLGEIILVFFFIFFFFIFF